eukprot:scaffold1328_cov375-Pavlova_lutheri.AAC.13
MSLVARAPGELPRGHTPAPSLDWVCPLPRFHPPILSTLHGLVCLAFCSMCGGGGGDLPAHHHHQHPILPNHPKKKETKKERNPPTAKKKEGEEGRRRRKEKKEGRKKGGRKEGWWDTHQVDLIRWVHPIPHGAILLGSTMEGKMVRSFPSFPYDAYVVQQQLMEAVHVALEQKRVGLFESPTGTGKTLSLLCSALEWLKEHRTKEDGAGAENQEDADDEEEEEEEEPEWVRAFPRKADATEREGTHSMEEARNQEADQVVEQGVEAEHLRTGKGAAIGVPPKTRIYFCSRTHSQLSQVVREFHKIKGMEDIAMVAVASRQVLCINESVKKMPTATAVTEKCMDLQRKANKRSAHDAQEGRNSKKEGAGCPYLQEKDTQISDLGKKLLAQAMEIEEVVDSGMRKGACPYYSSRKAVESADVVLLPYQALFHRDARDALGISLEGNVVIVDEAHNIVDAVSDIYSTALSKASLMSASNQLSSYFQHVKGKLSPELNRCIRVLVSLAKKIAEVLRAPASQADESAGRTQQNAVAVESVWSINEFMFAAGLDNFNIFRILEHAKQSKLMLRVSSYTRSRSVQLLSDSAPTDQMSSLFSFVEFLQTLCHGNSDGRVILHRGESAHEVYLKFMMLNTNHAFKELAENARAVLLVGGTLTPMEDIRSQLLAHVQKSRISTFSCGHIVSRDRVLPICIPVGPSGRALTFTHPQRSSVGVIDELGGVLASISAHVPGGLVVFFPSYAYEAEVYARWSASGFLSKLKEKKKVIREPRTAADVDKVLEVYGAAAKAEGAILLCIIGGKMSEGINFSDDMGRCVLVVGLPYPNPHSLEVKEKIKYLEREHQGLSMVTKKRMEYLENICMKSVNQSIGRAIRHKLDYATIILADSRWSLQQGGSRKAPVHKLSSWIRDSLVPVPGDFKNALQMLDDFFARHRGSPATDSHKICTY